MKTGARAKYVAKRPEIRNALETLYGVKIGAPDPPKTLIRRERLLNRLTNSPRVTLIVAPAGAGKTTLLSDLARLSTRQTTWYAIDDLDDSPDNFLAGVARALRREIAPNAEPREKLAGIVDALDQAGRGDLILDDVHRLPDRVVSTLAQLLRYAPPGVRLMLSGRRAPTGLEDVLTWFAAREQLSTVSWLDLQLDAREVEQARGAFRDFSGDRRGGWIIAWSRPSGLNLAEYLRREVIAERPPDELERLTRLSVLPAFDAGVVSDLIEQPVNEARAWLSRVHETTPLLERGGETYRFTETARAVLAELLVEPDRARRDAARALSKAAPLVAADLYLSAGDQDNAASVLATLPLTTWLTQSQTPEHQILARLEKSSLSSFPRLQLARAHADAIWLGDIEEALDLARVRTDRPLEEQFWALYLQARANYACQRLDVVRSMLPRIASTVDEMRLADSDGSLSCAACLCRQAVVEGLLGEYSQANRTADIGLTLAEAVGEPPPTRALLHHTRGLHSYRVGEYGPARQHISAALALVDQDPARVAQATVLRNLGAAIDRCLGHSDRAIDVLEKALGEPLLADRERAILLIELGHGLMDLAQFTNAAKRYQEAIDRCLPGDRDGLRGRALSSLVIALTQLGLVNEASTKLRAARANGARAHDLFIAEGFLALAHGNCEEAAEYFGRAADQPDTLGGLQDYWFAQAMAVRAFWSFGDATRAAAVVSQVLAQIPLARLPALGAWVTDPIAPILAAANPSTVQETEVAPARSAATSAGPGRVLNSRGGLDRLPSEFTSDRTIRVRLLGRPALFIGDRNVSFPVGLRRKAVELLWYLGATSGRADRQRIKADLFPDTEGASHALAVALSDLRRFLGNATGAPGDSIIVKDGRDGLIIEPSGAGLAWSTDVLELLRLARDLRSTKRRPVPVKVPGVFNGEFLAGLECEWVMPARRYWATVSIRTLGALALRYQNDGSIQNAVICHQRILELDSAIESSHIALLTLYGITGDELAVESQIRLYRRIMSEELDEIPSDDVEHAYRENAARARKNRGR